MARQTLVRPEADAETGMGGQLYLASGSQVALRMWDEEPTGGRKPVTSRTYETVGYVLEGRAILVVENQSIELHPGDSWVVPAASEHSYEVLERFKALEATSPPARDAGRDGPDGDRGVDYSPSDVMA